MRGTSAFVTVVTGLLSIGVVAAFVLREGGAGVATSRLAPDVARVVCEADSVRLAASAVRAGEDGVRILVQNRSRAQLLQIRSARGGTPPVELPLVPGGPNATIVALAPGVASVTCLADRTSSRGRGSAALSILDPYELWVSPRLSCSAAEAARFETAFAAGAEDATETAARTLAALDEHDRIVAPGYPGTRWHGDLVVVIRDGRTIARVTRAQDQGMWSVQVTACAGSRLAG